MKCFSRDFDFKNGCKKIEDNSEKYVADSEKKFLKKLILRPLGLRSPFRQRRSQSLISNRGIFQINGFLFFGLEFYR